MSATAAPPATPRIAGYETHPAAAIFPLLAGEDLERLTADVKAHGLLHPITLHEGQILDGRNRALACERAGVPVRTTPWTGSGSPVAWVVSQNLHRRHLTASQRAMVGAALVPLFEEEAKERERIGGREKGRANLPEAEKGRAREKAAEAVNVSPRSVADAVVVTTVAPPETVEAVKAGRVPVSAAAKKVRQARPSSSPKPSPKAEKDWNCSLVLSVPHSLLPRVVKALHRLGFEGGTGTSRKLRLAADDFKTI